jgi:pimeloyl-ACP methyl ester carboxylesterase
MSNRHLLQIAPLVVATLISTSSAQESAPKTLDVSVNGRLMHVWTGELESRKPGQPVVILEAGGQGTVDAWRAILPAIGRLAPVIAYDRSGLGKSEFDGERPTVAHVADNLHALLAAARIPPPYMLVGHSWGGVFVRGFAAQYANEVAGLVFLDVTDYERTCDELKTVLPAPNCSPTLPPLPDSTPPGVRAHVEQVARYSATDFAEIRALRLDSNLPIAVLVGGKPPGPLPPNALIKNVNILRLIQIRHQADWALSSRAGLLLVSSQVGHDVVQDDPALVLQAVTHVLKHTILATK